MAGKASIEEGKGGGVQAYTAGKDVVGAAPKIGRLFFVVQVFKFTRRGEREKREREEGERIRG